MPVDALEIAEGSYTQVLDGAVNATLTLAQIQDVVRIVTAPTQPSANEDEYITIWRYNPEINLANLDPATEKIWAMSMRGVGNIAATWNSEGGGGGEGAGTVFLPSQYGAVGDGVADDLAALETWAAAVVAARGRGEFDAGAVYRISDTWVLIGSDFEMHLKAGIVRPDAGVLVGVQLGDASNILFNAEISGLEVSPENYTDTEDAIGIALRNVANVTFDAIRASNVARALVPNPGNGERVAYNSFSDYHFKGREYGIKFEPSGTGFANENVFIGGRCQEIGDEVLWHIYIPDGSTNSNRFYAPSVERDTTQGGAPLGAIFCDTDTCLFDHPRTEGTWAVASVHLGPNSFTNQVRAIRSDSNVCDEGIANDVQSYRGKHRRTNIVGGLIEKWARHANASAITGLSGSPTATTTSGSKEIVVSSATGIALGDFLTVAGGVEGAQVQRIDGTSVFLDEPAFASVTDAALTRVAAPVVDFADSITTAGDSYVARFFMGRFGANSFFWKAFSRNNLRASLNGDGLLQIANQFYTLLSAYTTPPLRLGSYYLWMDSNGKLRVKTSAPSSSLDGSQVEGRPSFWLPPLPATWDDVQADGTGAGNIDLTNDTSFGLCLKWNTAWPAAADRVKFTGKNVPGGNWTLTALLDPSIHLGIRGGGVGIGVKESGGNKTIGFSIVQTGTPAIEIQANYWSSLTAFGATIGSNRALQTGGGRLIWLRLSWNGTNLKYEYSFNGKHWHTHADAAPNTGFTIGQYGFHMNAYDSTGSPTGDLMTAVVPYLVEA